MCDRSGLSIAEVVRANEAALLDEASIDHRLDRLTAVMFDCIDRRMKSAGELPGGLKVKRRARALHARLKESECRNLKHSIPAMDYASVYAIAVSRRRAGGAGADQRRRRRHPRRAALLSRALPGRRNGRRQGLPGAERRRVAPRYARSGDPDDAGYRG